MTTTMTAAGGRADLTLDRATHRYRRRLPDGSWVPVRTSVTGILRATVLRDVWAARNLEVYAAKAVIGQFVHEAAALASAGALDLDHARDACPRAVPYIEAWADCLDREGLSSLHHDELVHHPMNDYGGEIDVVGYRHGEPMMLDIKTGDTHGVHWQLFAYLDALWTARDRHLWFFDGLVLLSPLQIARYVVRLLPNGKYTIARSGDYAGASTVWYSCVTVFNQQRDIERTFTP